jgi:hypothetical protein
VNTRSRTVAQVCLAMLLAPVATAGGDPPAASGPQHTVNADAPGSAPPDPVICRKLPLTGSRIPERVCQPRSEWERWERRERLNEAMRGLVQTPPQSGG